MARLELIERRGWGWAAHQLRDLIQRVAAAHKGVPETSHLRRSVFAEQPSTRARKRHDAGMAYPPPCDEEFAPLAWYPWDSRPESYELSEDECATALYLSKGRLDKAANLLKVDERRLKKGIRRHRSLQVLLTRLAASPEGAARGRPEGWRPSAHGLLINDAEELVRPVRLEDTVKVHP